MLINAKAFDTLFAQQHRLIDHQFDCMTFPNAEPCTTGFVQQLHLMISATNQVREAISKWEPWEVLASNILD